MLNWHRTVPCHSIDACTICPPAIVTIPESHGSHMCYFNEKIEKRNNRNRLVVVPKTAKSIHSVCLHSQMDGSSVPHSPLVSAPLLKHVRPNGAGRHLSSPILSRSQIDQELHHQSIFLLTIECFPSNANRAYPSGAWRLPKPISVQTSLEVKPSHCFQFST